MDMKDNDREIQGLTRVKRRVPGGHIVRSEEDDMDDLVRS